MPQLFKYFIILTENINFLDKTRISGFLETTWVTNLNSPFSLYPMPRMTSGAR